MKSMTGYGSGVWKSEDFFVEAQLQSYNHKNFEVRLQISPFYTSMEGDLRKELQKKFSRGAFNLIVARQPLWPVKQSKMHWNKKQALKWKTLFNQMARSLKMKNDVGLLDLSQQPGVMELVSMPLILSTKEKAGLKALIRKVINLCDREKSREGQALKKDFQKNLRQFSLCLQNIKRHEARQRKTKHRATMAEPLNLFDNNQEEQKNRQAVAGLLLDRLDISEEISRLKAHVQAFRSLTASRGIMGKKMSFYLQEMIREANTIGSKSQDFKLTKAVVQAKSLIERMREQAHNIE